jgi:predicted O-linked N-acetylglucosamine transferase (SPINDLY family)
VTTARELVHDARASLRAGDVDAAIAKFTAAAERSPGDADAWLGLGACFAQRGRFDQAIAHFERASSIAPAAPVLLALVNALADAGRIDDAIARAGDLVARHPRFAAGWNALGVALARAGRGDDAARALGEALHVDAGYWRASASLARLALARGDLDVAAAAFERWIAADPGSFDARIGLARVRHRQARVVEAIARYGDALAIEPNDADARNDLGNAYTDVGEIARAQGEFRRALAIRPDYAEVHSNLLLNLHYGGDVGPQAMFAEHRAWAARHASFERIAASRRASDRVRIALVGSSFGAGPVGYFVEPLVAEIDRDRFELVCYSNHPMRDAVAGRIASRAAASLDVGAMSDDELASRIAADGADIAIDLSGHTPGNRLRALARKPARLVATWLDYFDTTGIDAVDCLLADAITVPEQTRQRFTEEVVRFAPCRLCYAPPAYAPAVAPPPSTRRAGVTFASFNRLSKLSPAARALWARIVAEVPGSRLLLKNAAFADAGARELFTRHFAALGVPADRLELRAASPHVQMLAEYGDVDIALDPFPYNGGLTTCEALWMGVPAICLAGDSMIARQSASLASAAGFASFVANDADQYVSLAVEWAHRLDERVTLRRDMRERLRRSTLCDAATFARNWERALVEAWARK